MLVSFIKLFKEIIIRGFWNHKNVLKKHRMANGCLIVKVYWVTNATIMALKLE